MNTTLVLEAAQHVMIEFQMSIIYMYGVLHWLAMSIPPVPKPAAHYKFPEHHNRFRRGS
jgi:hypothetical protein